MNRIQVFERHNGPMLKNRWYDITDQVDVYAPAPRYEYMVMVNNVEVCLVKGIDEDISVRQLLENDPTAGPILTCIR